MLRAPRGDQGAHCDRVRRHGRAVHAAAATPRSVTARPGPLPAHRHLLAARALDLPLEPHLHPA